MAYQRQQHGRVLPRDNEFAERRRLFRPWDIGEPLRGAEEASCLRLVPPHAQRDGSGALWGPRKASANCSEATGHSAVSVSNRSSRRLERHL